MPTWIGQSSCTPAARARISGSSASSDAFDRTSCIRMVSSPMSSRVCCGRDQLERPNHHQQAWGGCEPAASGRQTSRQSSCRTRSCASHQETAAFVQSTESPRPGLLTVIPNGVAVNRRCRSSRAAQDTQETGMADQIRNAGHGQADQGYGPARRCIHAIRSERLTSSS